LLFQFACQLQNPRRIDKGLGNFRARIAHGDRALHRLQQADLVFTPMLAPPSVLGSRRFLGFDERTAAFQNLQPATIATHHRQLRRRHALRRLFALGQRQRLILFDRLLPLGHAFGTDPLAHPLHLLDRHFDLGQPRQVVAALRERRIAYAGINDLIEHRHAVRTAIHAQTLALREKKPADMGGSNSAAHPIPLRRPASARCVAPGQAGPPPDPRNRGIFETAPAAAPQFGLGVRVLGPTFFPRGLVLPP
jgi:hypothetical protein